MKQKIDLIQSKWMKLDQISFNGGQIDGIPANPRTITPEDYELLKKSLTDNPKMLGLKELHVRKFGDGLVVIDGNMRLKALRELGFDKAPVKIIPDDWSAEDIIEYIIKANTPFGDWDVSMLKEDRDAEKLKEWGVDISEWGDDEMISDTSSSHEGDFDETQVKNDFVEKGDIWLCGDHRLMCGDSTSESDIALLCANNRVDLWITDPPYNTAYTGRTKDALKIENDNMNSEDFYKFLYSAFSAAYSVLKEGSSFYIWFASKEHINFEKALNDVGLKVREELIWVKNSMTLGRQDYQWRHEPCLYGWKEGASHNWYNDRSQTTCLEFNKPTRNGEHPTMKPVELFAYQIGNSSKKGDFILDTFGGSGTTMIACEQIGRKAALMELDPHYCSVIVERFVKEHGSSDDVFLLKDGYKIPYDKVKEDRA